MRFRELPKGHCYGRNCILSKDGGGLTGGQNINHVCINGSFLRGPVEMTISNFRVPRTRFIHDTATSEEPMHGVASSK